MILIADMCDKKNYKSQKDYIYESLEKLIDYFIEYGIPKKMYVRDNQTKAIVKDSTEYYNKDAKPGSLASKAAMVQKYNEKHNKK